MVRKLLVAVITTIIANVVNRFIDKYTGGEGEKNDT